MNLTATLAFGNVDSGMFADNVIVKHIEFCICGHVRVDKLFSYKSM